MYRTFLRNLAQFETMGLLAIRIKGNPILEFSRIITSTYTRSREVPTYLLKYWYIYYTTINLLYKMRNNTLLGSMYFQKL